MSAGQRLKLEDWQKHINRMDQNYTAWCGEPIPAEGHFMDAEHALLTVAQGQRLQPCPACADALMAVLRRVDRDQFPPLSVDPFGDIGAAGLTTAQRTSLARDLGIDVAAARRAGVGLGLLDPEQP